MNDEETNSKLWSLFDSIKDEKTMIETKGIMESKQKEVLIVDGYNLFIRAYMAIPTLNEDGIHTGGVSGFMKGMGYAIKLFGPDRVVVVFDGVGGSQKRRKIYPEYKDHKRTKVRLNRIYEENTSLGEEEVSLKRQLQRIVIYLTYLPVYMVSLDQVEADDTIAHMALDYYKDWKVRIMSADKDFLQLVNDRISVWSPTKKRVYTPQDIIKEYGVSSDNFIFFKALQGDVSDNIPGITGFGPKTVIKAFPFLNGGKSTLDVIKHHGNENKGSLKVYDTLLDNWADFERNYALMQLTDSYIRTVGQLRIKEVLDNQPPKMDENGLAKMILEDKLWSSFPNFRGWVNEVFGRMNKILRG
jgi:5'-3' exonuclease